MSKTLDILNRVYDAPLPEAADLEYLLNLTDKADIDQLVTFADEVRAKYVGDGVLLRGLVEFSNHCRNNCLYCGLNKDNSQIKRYRLDKDQILACVEHLYSDKIRTVVLQSGEEDDLDAQWFAGVIKEIKTKSDIAITLSVGERSTEDYKLWRDAGADRYLLKIESSNKELYDSMHPDMKFEERVAALKELKSLGYQIGSGCIVGLKGQTLAILAEDIRFFAKIDLDMIGVGPFIPHQATKLKDEKTGDLDMVVKAVALVRIVTKNTHLPATTATGSIGEGDGRIRALSAGANVLMPNYTPLEYKKLYEIYPGKRCVDEPAGACSNCMESMARSIGRNIDYSRGDSLKRNIVAE